MSFLCQKIWIYNINCITLYHLKDKYNSIMTKDEIIIELYKILDHFACIEINIKELYETFKKELNKLYELKDKIEENGTK